MRHLIRRLFRRRPMQLDKELRFHLDQHAAHLIARGHSPEQADREARLAFGGFQQVKEECRDARPTRWLEGLLRDLRYSLRTLRKSPAFTLVVIASLALGIGANTAIFTLINAALLKMLPVRNPEQLVEFNNIQTHGLNVAFSYPAFQEFRAVSPVLSGTLAFRQLYNIDFEVNGHGGLANDQIVSGDYFSVLGVRTVLGRAITMDDETSRSLVAVIGYDYWRTRFALDPEVVGMKILLNNAPFTVIGVTAPEFFGLEPGARIDVSVPLTTIERLMPGFAATGTPFDIMTSRVRNWLLVMGRRKPGVTTEQASAYLSPIFAREMQVAADTLTGPMATPPIRESFRSTRLQLNTGGQGLATLRERFSKPLIIVMAVVALLLLVTCANIANLMQARGNARQREIAVRLAIGAGRSRLIRQLIAESVLLAMAGGALGLVLAFWSGKSLLPLMAPSGSPIALNVRPDPTVLIFTLVISGLTALLFGLVPAWRAARLDVTPLGLQSARSSSMAVRSRLGKALVIVQVAVSLVLVIGAGLLTRSLAGLKNFYPGFNKDNVLLVSLSPLMVGYQGEEQQVSLYGRLLDRFAAIPGVRSATFSVHGLLNPNVSTSQIRVEGRKIESRFELASIGVEPVGPRYFETIETPVLLGRDFTANDRVRAVKVAAINQTAARFYFGDANPIGRRISMPGYRGDPSWLEIIAVVQDAKYHDLREQPLPMVYISQFQYPEAFVVFEIRTAIQPAYAATAVTNAVKAIDPRLPVFGVKTLNDQLDDSLIDERLVASLSSAFGALALLVAAIGLYGLMAYAVNRRTNEIGIRMALGAKPAKIAGMVLRETLFLVGIGLAIGIPAAMIASRLITSQLYGLKPSDPATILLASLLTATIAALAGYLPARRAARVDPMIALRHE
jgi:predicted permease